MKSYTDIEQSKKLAEILPLESADMWWIALNWQETEYYVEVKQEGIDQPKKAIPCWSIASLIEVLPADWWGYTDHYFLEISKMGDASSPNEVRYFRFRKDILDMSDRITHISHSAENLVDACVNMIITLHDHKLLPIK